MKSRRISIRIGLDILIWAQSMKGTFTIKEAYHLTTQQGQDESAPIWKQIWQSKWWPKVTLFLWLVGKGHILTWDQLQKLGPPDAAYVRKTKKFKNIF